MLNNISNYVIARYICNFKLDGYHKVNCISKEIGYRNNRDTWRRWFIPKFTMEANLRSRGVDHNDSKLPMAHLILLVPSPMRSATIHYGKFEGGHRSHTRLGWSPQFNWRLPTISCELPKLWDSNKVPKASKAPTQQQQPSRALQVPKRNKL